MLLDGGQLVRQLLQCFAQHVVIIPAPRIARKDGVAFALGRRRLVVQLSDADHERAPGSRFRGSRRTSARRSVR